MIEDLSLKYLLAVPSRRDAAESMPTVITIHGRGANAHDLADLAPLFDTAAGCRFIFPNAPKPFEVYPGMTAGWTWFDGWPPLHESIVESRTTFLRFIDEIGLRYPTTALVIAGFSQGALMSLDAGLRTAQKVAGIVAMSGGLYDRDLPDLASRRETPVFMAHGTGDEVVSVMYARRARNLLESAGIEVEYHEYPMAHQVTMEEAEEVRAFIARVT